MPPPSSSTQRPRPAAARPRPASAYPPPPPPMVFNPFWLCCLFCPDDLSTKISTCAGNTADACFDGAADACGQIIGFIFGPFMIFLGPLMALAALGIIGLLAYAFFTIVLPMQQNQILHASIVVFLLINVYYNYFMCAMVKNRDGDAKYESVVRELAAATGFAYPETEEEIATFRKDYEKKLEERSQRMEHVQEKKETEEHRGRNVDQLPANGLRKRSSSATKVSTAAGTTAQTISNRESRPTKMPPWMLLGPEEWGYCKRSNKPKPPRSHYDRVTKSLILNFDHYCPWTFNAVGYFNYRYFVSFIIHVFWGMLYSLYIGYRPFSNRYGELYERQIQMSLDAGHATIQHMTPFVPTPQERLTLGAAYVFVILTFVGVGYLFYFHLYLVLSAQTTIEERGNNKQKEEAEFLGKVWTNPYSLDRKQNWQMIFGSSPPLLALLPSNREPEFLPLPINGKKLVRRSDIKQESSNKPILLQCNVV